MGSMAKMRKRYESEQMARRVMDTPEFKQAMRKQEEQAVLKAICTLSFMACGYLETRHGYKANGLKKFLDFIKLSLECTTDDESFFVEYAKYYKEEYDLDVLGVLGMGLED